MTMVLLVDNNRRLIERIQYQLEALAQQTVHGERAQQVNDLLRSCHRDTRIWPRACALQPHPSACKWVLRQHLGMVILHAEVGDTAKPAHSPAV